MSQAKKRIVTFIVLPALVLVLSCASIERRQSERLRAQLDLFPVPSGFRQVSEAEVAKLTHSSVTRRFVTNMTSDEVEAYYGREAKQLGWRFESRRDATDWGDDLGGFIVVYVRDDYELQIQFAGSKANYGWNWAISVGVG